MAKKRSSTGTAAGGTTTGVPRDMKRLKAKVGKRAPSAPNVTDTTFRSSSIRVGTQRGVDEGSSSSKRKREGEDLGGELLSSSRGRVLNDLLHKSTSHPAPAARASALRGIRDVVVTTAASSSTSPYVVLSSHLPSLIPALSSRLTDEDGTVRCLALSTLKSIFNGGDGGDAEAAMGPFLPLHVAHLIGAFNSLDELVRVDAVDAVRWTATNFPRGLAGGSGGGTISDGAGSYVDGLLPSYARLLASSTGGGGGGEGSECAKSDGRRGNRRQNKSQHRKGGRGGARSPQGRNSKRGSGGPPSTSTPSSSKSENRRCRILQSLLALLRCGNASSKGDCSREGHDGCCGDEMDRRGVVLGPDLTFVPGGHASNAFIVTRGGGRWKKTRRLGSVVGLDDLSAGLQGLPADDFEPMDGDHMRHDLKHRRPPQRSRLASPSTTSSPRPETSPSLSARFELLTVLRDAWVEVVQRGTRHGKGIFLRRSDVEEFGLIVECTIPFWSGYCGEIAAAAAASAEDDYGDYYFGHDKKGGYCEKEASRWRALTDSLARCALEALPVRDEDVGEDLTALLKGKRWEAGRRKSPKKKDHEDSASTSYDRVNASLCRLLGDMCPRRGGSNTAAGGDEWVDVVLEYVMTRLNDECVGGEEDYESSSRGDASAASVDDEDDVIDVVRLLLLPSSGEGKSNEAHSSHRALLPPSKTEEKAKRTSLLVKFVRAYLPSPSPSAGDGIDGGEDDGRVGSSSTSSSSSSIRRKRKRRRAIHLACDLISRELERGHFFPISSPSRGEGEGEDDDDDDGAFSKELVRVASTCLPAALAEMGGDDPTNSALVIRTLSDVVRRTCTTSAKGLSGEDPMPNGTGSSESRNGRASSSSDEELVRRIRDNMASLFAAPSSPTDERGGGGGKRRRGKRVGGKLVGSTGGPSAFELLPSTVQRLAVGLVGLLGSPTAEVTSSLSRICYRASSSTSSVATRGGGATVTGCDNGNGGGVVAGVMCSQPVATYIHEMMHSIRRTMPLQQYLTFVVGSSVLRPGTTTTTTTAAGRSKRTGRSAAAGGEDGGGDDDANEPQPDVRMAGRNGGLTSPTPSTSTTSMVMPPHHRQHLRDDSMLFSSDESVERTCRAFVNAGPASTVLPPLGPILVGRVTDAATSSSSVQVTVGARAAVAILAAFASHGRRRTGSSALDLVELLPPRFGEVLSRYVCDHVIPVTVEMLADDDGCGSDGTSTVARLLLPIWVILCCQPKLMNSLRSALDSMPSIEEACGADGGAGRKVRLICSTLRNGPLHELLVDDDSSGEEEEETTLRGMVAIEKALEAKF